MTFKLSDYSNVIIYLYRVAQKNGAILLYSF